MLFKNLSIYRITKDMSEVQVKLEEVLSDGAFESCLSSQAVSRGWCQPLGKRSEMFTHTVSHCTMISQRTEEKIMPAAAINAKLEDKVELIEISEGRKLSRKEKSSLKEEIVFDLMPKALSKYTRLYAYFDFKNNWFVVDSSSWSKADEIVNHVREMLGSFPVIPLTVNQLPSISMTNWHLNSESPDGFKFGSECYLHDPAEHANKASFSSHDILGDEVIELLRGGMIVKELSFVFKQNSSFVMTDKLGFKKLKFTDLVCEQAETAEDAKELFDIEFSILTGEVEDMVLNILKAFGGQCVIETSEEQFEMTGLSTNRE